MNFKDTVIKSYPTGSRYICNPAPTDTDNDTVFLVNGYYDYVKMLAEEGFDSTLSDLQYNTMGEFVSFRKGTENYIVTENPDFYADYVKATEGAKALNLLDKGDRIKLFQAIMAGYEKVQPVVPAQIDFNFDFNRAVPAEPIALNNAFLRDLAVRAA